jgi:Methyltransferase domain
MSSSPHPPPTYDHRYLDVKGWSERKFGVVSEDDFAVIDAEMRPHFSNGASVLELGFGNGGVASWCRENGIQWYGVEVNPILVQAAISSGFQAYSSITEIPPHIKFDGAAAFDVLEHIPQDAAAGWLRDITARLSENATLVLRFPNGDSPFGRIAQNADPTHVNAIGRGKLIHYCGETGLAISSLRAPIIPLSGIGLRRRMSRWLVVKLRYAIAQFCRFVFFGGVFIPLDSNYVAILRKKR